MVILVLSILAFPGTLHSVRGNFCSAEERSNTPCISRVEKSLLQVFSDSQKRGELDSPYPGSEGCATHLFVVCCTGAISSPVDLSDARFHISDICFSGCLLQLHRVLLQPVLSLSKRVFRWRTEVADSLGEIAWHLV